MYLSRDVKFTLCYLFFCFQKDSLNFMMSQHGGGRRGVMLSSHKTTVPMSSLLLAGTVLCVKDSERNKIKLSWIYLEHSCLCFGRRLEEGRRVRLALKGHSSLTALSIWVSAVHFLLSLSGYASSTVPVTHTFT